MFPFEALSKGVNSVSSELHQVLLSTLFLSNSVVVSSRLALSGGANPDIFFVGFC